MVSSGTQELHRRWQSLSLLGGQAQFRRFSDEEGPVPDDRSQDPSRRGGEETEMLVGNDEQAHAVEIEHADRSGERGSDDRRVLRGSGVGVAQGENDAPEHGYLETAEQRAVEQSSQKDDRRCPVEGICPREGIEMDRWDERPERRPIVAGPSKGTKDSDDG